MAMQQADIQQHYEIEWAKLAGQKPNDSPAPATSVDPQEPLRYSSPIEDGVLYPAYERLIQDHRLVRPDSRLLAVGAGSGRWVRFFDARFKFASLAGIDFTRSSVELLTHLHRADPRMRFHVADITQPGLELGGQFDLINIANVLFHIPEPDRFAQALSNLSRLVSCTGRIVTTEYLPRTTMRTNWMLVRSRYDFQRAIEQAGLRIVDTRAFCFFSNDPMGVDGHDPEARQHFHAVRQKQQQMLANCRDPATLAFMTNLFIDIERACLSFCKERLADVELPSQKLVVLERCS